MSGRDREKKREKERKEKKRSDGIKRYFFNPFCSRRNYSEANGVGRIFLQILEEKMTNECPKLKNIFYPKTCVIRERKLKEDGQKLLRNAVVRGTFKYEQEEKTWGVFYKPRGSSGLRT